MIAEVGKLPNVRKGAPDILRHVLQWQVVRLDGSTLLE